MAISNSYVSLPEGETHAAEAEDLPHYELKSNKDTLKKIVAGLHLQRSCGYPFLSGMFWISN